MASFQHTSKAFDDQTKNRLTLVFIIEFGARMVLDVVCGMKIDETKTRWKSEYKGKIYYFCGPMCKLEFDENPSKYVLPQNSGMDKK